MCGNRNTKTFNTKNMPGIKGCLETEMSKNFFFFVPKITLHPQQKLLVPCLLAMAVFDQNMIGWTTFVREPLEIIVAVEDNITEEQHNASTELVTSKSALQVWRDFFQVNFFYRNKIYRTSGNNYCGWWHHRIKNGHGYRQSHWVRLTVTVCILLCVQWESAWEL